MRSSSMKRGSEHKSDKCDKSDKNNCLTGIIIDLHRLIRPMITDRHRKEEIFLLKRIQRNLRKHKKYFF